MSVLASLAKLLPPPSYISMPSIGVDISDTSMKYVSFVPTLRHKATRVLDQWGDIEIPETALDRGEIKDAKMLANVMKEFKARTKAEYIRVSLPEERAYIFETEIKRDVPKKEIQSLLEFRLEENVPISARDALFDYELIPSKDKESVVRVVVAAYQKEVVMKYYEVCKEAELTPLSFEVEAQAMARAVVPIADQDTIMLVDFGKTRTGIGIVNSGVLLYTSTIDIGGGQLSQALRKTIGGDVSEKELIDLKNSTGLIKELDDAKVQEALLSTISVIKDEIASRMQYWHLKDDNRNDRRIKKIIICGGSANLKGLPEYLSEVLGVSCTRADVWQNAFHTELVVPPIDRRHSYGYAAAIGLAIKKIV
jgi:type IV pilus assembly protein PilM